MTVSKSVSVRVPQGIETIGDVCVCVCVCAHKYIFGAGKYKICRTDKER